MKNIWDLDEDEVKKIKKLILLHPEWDDGQIAGYIIDEELSNEQPRERVVIPNPPLEQIITSKRPLNILLKEGYQTYDDIKGLTLDDLRVMKGMGEVSARKAWMELEHYRKSLYKEVADKAMNVAEKVGIEKVLEVLEHLEKSQ